MPALDTFAAPELWTSFADFYQGARDASSSRSKRATPGAPRPLQGASRRAAQRMQFLSREVFEGAVTRELAFRP